jgi:hypothetical protein
MHLYYAALEQTGVARQRLLAVTQEKLARARQVRCSVVPTRMAHV